MYFLAATLGTQLLSKTVYSTTRGWFQLFVFRSCVYCDCDCKTKVKHVYTPETKPKKRTSFVTSPCYDLWDILHLLFPPVLQAPLGECRRLRVQAGPRFGALPRQATQQPRQIAGAEELRKARSAKLSLLDFETPGDRDALFGVLWGCSLFGMFCWECCFWNVLLKCFWWGCSLC